MNKFSSATLDEVIALEEEYSRKNKRQSCDIRNLISNHEKIILCCYNLVEIQNYFGMVTNSGRRPDLLFYILTDVKLLMSYQVGLTSEIGFIDIPLDKIKEIQIYPTSALFNIKPSGISIIGYTEFYRVGNEASDAFFIFEGIKDSDFLQKVGVSIRQTKANFDFGLRSPNAHRTTESNSNSTVEQLEKLADLYKSGVLSDDEYKRAKEKVLSKN